MKKSLVALLFFDTLLESFLLEASEKECVRAPAGKTVEEVSDAELSKLIMELVGETDDSFSQSGKVKRRTANKELVKRRKAESSEKKSLNKGKCGEEKNGGIKKLRWGAKHKVESCLAKLEEFPTGFNVGLDLRQAWDVARNFSKKGHAVAKDGRERIYYDLSSFSRVNRGHLDPVVSVGYSHLFGQVFLMGVAFEVALGAPKTQVSKGTLGSKTLSEEGKVGGISYAAKLRSGYCIQKIGMAVYGLIGVRWTKVDFRYLSRAGVATSLGKGAAVFGVGFEKKIEDRLSLSCEYEYCCRKSSSLVKAANPGNLKGNSRFFETSLHSNCLRVGLKYYF